jgi:hypothetical protein
MLKIHLQILVLISNICGASLFYKNSYSSIPTTGRSLKTLSPWGDWDISDVKSVPALLPL